jgi:hypothetical protein
MEAKHGLKGNNSKFQATRITHTSLDKIVNGGSWISYIFIQKIEE